MSFSNNYFFVAPFRARLMWQVGNIIFLLSNDRSFNTQTWKSVCLVTIHKWRHNIREHISVWKKGSLVLILFHIFFPTVGFYQWKPTSSLMNLFPARNAFLWITDDIDIKIENYILPINYPSFSQKGVHERILIFMFSSNFSKS